MFEKERNVFNVIIGVLLILIFVPGWELKVAALVVFFLIVLALYSARAFN